MFLSKMLYLVGLTHTKRESRIIKEHLARQSRIVGPVNVNGLVRIPNKIRKRCEGARR